MTDRIALFVQMSILASLQTASGSNVQTSGLSEGSNALLKTLTSDEETKALHETDRVAELSELQFINDAEAQSVNFYGVTNEVRQGRPEDEFKASMKPSLTPSMKANKIDSTIGFFRVAQKTHKTIPFVSRGRVESGRTYEFETDNTPAAATIASGDLPHPLTVRRVRVDGVMYQMQFRLSYNLWDGFAPLLDGVRAVFYE